MDLKLPALTIAVVFTLHSNIPLLVVSQQNVQPYFTEWNGFYYIYLYEPGGSVDWFLASSDCESRDGELPVITVEERDALLDDFFRASSITNDNGFVWLGADCSGNTCTRGGGVLDDSLWDTGYPTPNATDDRALIWSKESGNVRDTSTENKNATEYFCKFPSLCDIDYVTCLAGGACLKVFRFTKPQCICNAGYQPASNYSDCLEINECASDPCQSNLNTSLCIDDVNSYRCECKIDGFTGELCETNIDDCHGINDACSGNGHCVDAIASFSCDCFTGYTGELCEVDIDDCELMDEPCHSNGTCVDGIDTYNCACVHGYTGERCEYGIGDCAQVEKPCNAHGACVDGIDMFNCNCSPGHTGERCEFSDDTTVEDHCALVDEPCNANGMCEDGVDSFICTCFSGYTGELCEVNIDECELADEPCHSNGTCVDGMDMFSCTCLPGYTGEHCEYAMNTTTAEERVSSSDNTLVIAIVSSLCSLALLAVALTILCKIRKRSMGSHETVKTRKQRASEATTVVSAPSAANTEYGGDSGGDSDEYAYGSIATTRGL